MKGFVRLSTFLVLLMLLTVLILCAPAVRTACAAALQLCCTVLIPSIFPFCVLSGLFIRLGFGSLVGRFLGKVMTRLFHLPACGASALMLGLLGGYPIGAVTVAELYRREEVTRAEAEQLSAFCCNAGPAFIVGAAGLTLFGSVRAGLYLYLVHSLSALLTGMLLSRSKSLRATALSKQEAMPFLPAIRESMSSACMSMLLICGYVVIFYILLDLLLTLPLISAMPLLWKGVFSGFFEISSAVARLYGCDFRFSFPIVAALLGWGGVCVHFQSISALTSAGLPVKPYLKGKLLQGFLSLLITIPIAIF